MKYKIKNDSDFEKTLEIQIDVSDLADFRGDAIKKIGSQLKLKERELNIYQWNYKNNQKKISSLEPRLKKAEQKIKYHQNLLGHVPLRLYCCLVFLYQF